MQPVEPSLQSVFAAAMRQHQAGLVAEAETLYRRILALEPRQPDAVHLLGVAAFQRGVNHQAVALVRRAITLNPMAAGYYSNLGNAQTALGQAQDAIRSYLAARLLAPFFAEAEYNLGNALVDLDRFRDSVTCFERALRLRPDYADAYANLAVALKALDRQEESVLASRAALRLTPAIAGTHANLGSALSALGEINQAVTAFRASLSLRPNFSEAYASLGNALSKAGRPIEAIAAYRAALQIEPSMAESLSNLGLVKLELGAIDEALALFMQALAIRPDYDDAHSHYGNGVSRLGRKDLAIAAFSRAIRARPDYAAAHSNLGLALKDLGQIRDASQSFTAALCCDPGFARAFSNLGVALADRGLIGAALIAYRRALHLAPDLADAHTNRGQALRDLGRLAESDLACRTALCLRPDLAEAWSNLGNQLSESGRFREAATAYRSALLVRPDYADAHSNLLMSLHYDPDQREEPILAEARIFGARQEAGLSPPTFCARSAPGLRIGYVSGDFRRHPVGYFIARILACHDRQDFSIFCYSSAALADDLTSRLRGLADHWRSLVGLSDQAAAELIREDQIDILVDLSGHTQHNRLGVFARKPAPIQLSWLGFWGSTGLSRMDYILSDAVTIADFEESLYSESVLRLAPSRFCYAPPDYAPAPQPPPALERGRISFGSFNNLTKLGPALVRHWSMILSAVPGSRLVLKWRTLADPRMRERVTQAFAAHQIPADRLDLRAASPHAAMLAEYHDIDIALDPFPFSGGLTSCEALWMGVPVVTLPGARAVSRQTESILRAAGLAEWVAASPEDHIRIVTALAGDLDRLAELRAGLRARLEASSLCDGPGFTCRLETIYRAISSQLR